MELKELSEKTLELFEVDDFSKLGDAIYNSLTDETKLDAFCDMVDGDLSVDWLQMIYQYYLADRKGKKQDYTPRSLGKLMTALARCNSKNIDMFTIDLCAGTGALIIQKWNAIPEAEFTAFEIDESVIPFLLMNMVIRNIQCTVIQKDVLLDTRPEKMWRIFRGEKYGKIVDIESTLQHEA